MTDHSAVRVMLGVRDLERLLRDAYENHQKSETRTGVKDANWERSYAQYIINRLAVADSSDELLDPGSTSNLITESDNILLPNHGTRTACRLIRSVFRKSKSMILGLRRRLRIRDRRIA